MDVVVHDVMTGTSGFYGEDGKIHFALSGKMNVARVAAHELTHQMKVDAKEQYNAVRDQIIENVGKEKFEALLERKAKEYGVDASTEQGRAVVDDEVIAQLCEDMLSDTSKLESFAERHLEAAKALKERLVKILNAIKEALKGVGDYTSDLIADQKTVDKWLNGLDAVLAKAEGRTESQQETGVNNPQYLIVNNGKFSYVKADRQVFTSSNIDNRQVALENYLNALIGRSGRLDIPTVDGEMISITTNETGRTNTVGKISSFDEYIDSQGNVNEEAVRLKQNIALHIDEVIAVSIAKGNNAPSVDSNYKHDQAAQRGWRYRKAFFEDFDGSYYEFSISIPENSAGQKFAYNINKISKAKNPQEIKPSSAISGSSHSGARAEKGFTSMNISKSSQNVKTNFALDSAVEETRDLIAVHNVSADNLLKTLKLDGFPAVSIAITKAKNGWSSFGNISVVFGKETVDPQQNADNHVFGADAYTPEFPKISRNEPNVDLYGRVPHSTFLGRDLTQELRNDVESDISPADFVKKYRNDAAMMQAFQLETKGKPIPVVFEKSRQVLVGNKKYDAIEKIFVDVLGEKNAERVFTAGRLPAYQQLTSMEEDRIINAVHQAGYDAAFNSDFDEMLLTQYIGALQRRVDMKASERVIKQATNAQEYEKWLRSYAEDTITGYFYSIRSDRAMPVTADNAVSIMKEDNLLGNYADVEDPYIMLAREYGSIDAIRQDKERLNGHRRKRDGSVQERYARVMNQILHKNSVFSVFDQKVYAREIAAVVRKSEGGSSMQQIEKLWEDLENTTGLQITDKQVEELASIRDTVWSAETPLFEAKPMRNIPLSEAKLVIVPEGTSQELLDALNKNNIPVETYEAGNEQARLDLLNGATAQKYMFATDDLGLDGYRKPITMQDVEVLRSIGRKSVNSFTSADLQKAGKWAYKMNSEMKEKSPFFRAWFGDWRAKDVSPIAVASIPAYTDTTKSDVRGSAINADTKWNIRISRNGVNNTESHAGNERKSVYGLAGIKELIAKAILLDTEVHEHHANNAANDPIAFDHKLYALGKDDSGETGLYKITVEDYFQSKKEQSNKRFHNLKYIEKVADIPADALSDKHRSGGSANEKSAINYNVADLYAFVKQYDKDFTAAREVSPMLLNEDGTPKRVFHGTLDARATEVDEFGWNSPKPNSTFTVFNRSKSLYTDGDSGAHFFASNRKVAEAYAPAVKQNDMDKGREPHVYDAFLKMENPLVIEGNGAAWNAIPVPDFIPKKQYFNYKTKEYQLSGTEKTEYFVKYARENGYDGVIFKDIVDYNAEDSSMLGDVYAVFDSTQIKSATDNIGLFDRNNPDIRYALDPDLLRETVTAIDTKALEEGLGKLSVVNELKWGEVWLKEPSRIFDSLAGDDKELRNALYEIFEKPHSDATGRYASNIQKMQARVEQIAMDAGALTVNKKGKKTFHEDISAAIQNYGEGYQMKECNREGSGYVGGKGNLKVY